jgi:hypothetical protein
MRTTRFEFQAYKDGTASEPDITFADCIDRGAAKGLAGTKAKRCNGPVDIAFAGEEPWAERYITTASPSEFHKSGFRFERLD